MNTRNLTLTLLTVGLLAVTAFASTAAAKPGPGSEGERGSQRDDRQEMRDNRSAERQDRQEKMRDAHDAWQDCKRDFRAANGTLNESMQAHCMGEKSFFLNATHARREARALVGAIAALERRIGRLEVRQHILEDRLAAGNLTANQTAELQKRLDRIEEQQDRMADKVVDMRERLAALHEKWQSVRQEEAKHRHGEDSEDDDAEDSSSESASESASESESESESETSTSA